MGVDCVIDGDFPDDFREDFRKKHLDRMRRDFFKGRGEPRGEKKTEGKRKTPTKKERRNAFLFKHNEVVRHNATNKGSNKVLNSLYAKYDAEKDEWILCDIKRTPLDFEGVGTAKNLNQFIIINNKKYVPEKVQKETAYSGCVKVYRNNEWISVGKIEPLK
jgi:hypothetical protein